MVIADTGFWVALANSRDKHHEIAKYRFIELSEQGERFVTTWPVMTETLPFAVARIGAYGTNQIHAEPPKRRFRGI